MKSIITFLSALLLNFSLVSAAHAQIVDGAPATDLLGQFDETSLTAPVPLYTKAQAQNAPTRLGLGCVATAYDTVHHRLFVADNTNNRVLVFNLTAGNLLVDHVPDFVLGQDDFASGSAHTTRDGFDSLADLAYDAAGDRLFVADFNNKRVLVFDVASITNGEDAASVLGQPNFTSSANNVTASGMTAPTGLAFDSVGNRLFVAQLLANRVTVFDTASITDGENAVNVLGQANFTDSNGNNNTNTGLNNPEGLDIDTAGNRLFVALSGSNRVVVFNNTNSLSNGQAAANILGQMNFAGVAGNLSDTGLSAPRDAVYDSTTGRLFVADGNVRITVYDASTVTNGEAATDVIGQSSFTTDNIALTRAGLNSPRRMSLNPAGQILSVADIGWNRVMLFDVTAITVPENAVDMLGRYDETTFSDPVPIYTVAGGSSEPNRFGLSFPSGSALDTVNHRLFVADSNNNRVLVYNLTSSNAFADRIPDNVIGQPNFYTNEAQTAQNGFSTPQGLAFDATNNRLFVTDHFNYRVLIFDTASITDGENAIRVLGQGDFTSSNSPNPPDAGSMNDPLSVAVDPAHDRLFVSDSSNFRVLVFDVAVANMNNGEDAVHVLGQADFTSKAVTSTSSSVGPLGIAYDATTNRLFVADQASNRVAIFDTTTITDNEPAVNVIGQATVTDHTFGISRSRVSTPTDLSVDASGQRLFVAQDPARITVFDIDPSTFVNGADALSVLGQADFTSSADHATRTGLSIPLLGMAFDPINKRLFANDGGAHRVLQYKIDVAASYNTSTFGEANANDGSISNSVSVTLSGDTFAVTNGAMTSGVHFSASNVPSGLTLTVTGTSSTTATIALTGNASAHESINDISNLTVAFLDPAFSLVPAAGIVASTKNNIAVDFNNAPTPTPTATPTPTSTPTATPTPTVTPTVTPTALPGTITGRLVDGDGNGIANVVVYLSQVSSSSARASAADTGRRTASTLTDQNGRYTFSNLETGTYQVTPSLTGYSFQPPTVSLSDGNNATSIAATPVELNDSGCTRQERASELVTATNKAQRLQEYALTKSAAFRAQAARRLPTRDARELQSVLSHAESGLNNALEQLFALSADLPTLTLQCNGKAGCESVNSSRKVRRYKAGLGVLRRLGLFTLRAARDGLGEINGDSRIGRTILRLHAAASRAARKLPGKTDVCS